MKQYSFLTEGFDISSKKDHPHPFKVGDKVMVRHGIRCTHSGKIGRVVKVEPHEKYDYDVITVSITVPADTIPDPIMKHATDGKCRIFFSLNDGSFEKVND